VALPVVSRCEPATTPLLIRCEGASNKCAYCINGNKSGCPSVPEKDRAIAEKLQKMYFSSARDEVSSRAPAARSPLTRRSGDLEGALRQGC
jgi:hypothetical protein